MHPLHVSLFTYSLAFGSFGTVTLMALSDEMFPSVLIIHYIFIHIYDGC